MMAARKMWSLGTALAVGAALVLGSCGGTASDDVTDDAVEEETIYLFEGSAAGIAQFGGDGNHDGLTNAKACNETEDVSDYYKVTTYTSFDGSAVPLGPVHIEMVHCNTETGPVSGQAAFVTVSGGVVYAEYTGRYVGDTTVVDLTFMPANSQTECYLLGEIACESTGRFAAASGAANLSVTVTQEDSDPFVPWPAEVEWTDGILGY